MKKTLLFFLISIIAGNSMSQTTNKEQRIEDMPTITLLDAFANAFNAHDAEKIVAYMTEDCIFEASSGPEVDGQKFIGKEAVKKAFEDIFKNFPDARWNHPHHFIAGDRAVSEWTFRGTKADGTLVEVTGCDLFTFRDGKIFIKNSYRKNRPALPKS
jgi:taurine dehydrogenase small subunit